MAWTGVGAVGVYLVTVVAVRRTLARRWSGTRFVVLDVRRWTPSEWVAAALAASAAAAVVGGTIAAALHHRGAGLSPAVPWMVPATLLIVGAAVLMVCSQLTMGSAWRIGVDRDVATVLVTTGPFRRVRNPIYTSLAALATGMWILVPTAVVGAGWLATIAFIEWQVRVVEEPFLARRHGAAYVRWSVDAGRFVPGVGALH